MINNNILGLIGLAMKAGKVAFGADSVEESIVKKKVRLVIISEDSSERTKNKLHVRFTVTTAEMNEQIEKEVDVIV